MDHVLVIHKHHSAVIHSRHPDKHVRCCRIFRVCSLKTCCCIGYPLPPFLMLACYCELQLCMLPYENIKGLRPDINLSNTLVWRSSHEYGDWETLPFFYSLRTKSRFYNVATASHILLLHFSSQTSQ